LRTAYGKNKGLNVKTLSDRIIRFFQNQGFVIVSTIDSHGRPHSSCKGIIKITKTGQVYLLDLYKERTFRNLKRNPYIAITAIDEHRFKGFCLKGKAEIIRGSEISLRLIAAWEERITQRITQRLLKNLRGEKGHPRHPEILLPKPKYMIVMEIKEVVDLTPHHIKRK